jgi:transcriptional regulator with XRE-family HTH domain
MTNFADRLREALDKRGMKQIELSNRAGINKSSVSTYLKGGYYPKYDTIVRFAEILNVSPEWLAGKDVPMEKTAMTDEMLKFALFNSADGVTDEMLDEVKAFAEFVKNKKR